jgi:preprotein translocase subunit SecG
MAKLTLKRVSVWLVVLFVFILLSIILVIYNFRLDWIKKAAEALKIKEIRETRIAE